MLSVSIVSSAITLMIQHSTESHWWREFTSMCERNELVYYVATVPPSSTKSDAFIPVQKTFRLPIRFNIKVVLHTILKIHDQRFDGLPVL